MTIHRATFPVLLLALSALLSGCSLGQAPAVHAGGTPTTGECPEPRTTQRAPDSYHGLANPLTPSAENIARGRELYVADRSGGSCAACHGVHGGGDGIAGQALAPPPRNFTCAPTMTALSDGQLFWVIESGSGAFHEPARQGAQQVARPGRRESFSAMTSYRQQLSDAEIWQLVLYIRSLAGTAPGKN
ncbi:MAG TPA: cytochrome c [Gammaproteobacteria bacterium]|nr:cytochrome c [Gammaproteobacteria bacterium]HRP87816.1 cytochrome c [Gammaproteobacteria bacterium]